MAEIIVSRDATHTDGQRINNVNPRGLFVHALSVFRSPKKSFANDNEPSFLFRKGSKWNR